MAQFERLITPSEQEVAGTLKSYIADVQDNPQQVVKHTISAQFLRYCVCVWNIICMFALRVPVNVCSCLSSCCRYFKSTRS